MLSESDTTAVAVAGNASEEAALIAPRMNSAKTSSATIAVSAVTRADAGKIRAATAISSASQAMRALMP